MKNAPSRRFLIFPFAFFLLALALRLPGLTWGLPSVEHWYSYHPDERQIAFAVANVADSGNPRFFNYPSLFIFLTYGAYLMQSMLGLNTPMVPDAPWPALRDIMLCGRLVSAVLGALTVPAVYLIAKKLTEAAGLAPSSNPKSSVAARLEEGASPAVSGSEKFALFAAFLMAVAPGHVQHSHFATVDVPATFFVAWSLYFAVLALTPGPSPNSLRGRGENRALFVSALLAGLAAATKYNAGLVIIAPLLAAFIPHSKFHIPNSLAILALAALGFFIGCPHSLLDTPTFLGDRVNQGFLYELLVHPRQGHGDVFVDTGNGWLYQLTFNLPFAFTAPGAVCALIGCVAAARTKNKTWLPLLAFAALYFLAIGTSQVRFMRYLFPLFPVLCLAAPLCFTLLPRAAQKFGAAALALLMFIGATNVLYPFCVPDPRDQAAAYLKKVVTQPVTIALINRPWFYTPPLWPQDYPPPSNVMSGVSPDGKFKFRVITVSVTNLDHLSSVSAFYKGLYLANEYEYRERWRLAPNHRFWLESSMREGSPDDVKVFKNHPPVELPGRHFLPHDFLYTNPEQWIFWTR